MVIATSVKPSPGAQTVPVASLALPAAVPGPRQVLVGDAEVLARFGLTAAGLRWNVVVDGLDLDAHAASGQLLRLGDTDVRLTFRCETCATLRDVAGPETLRALAVGARRGWLGVAVQGGTVRPGDPATLLPGRPFPTVPDTVADRFAWVAERIPPGRVMTYRTMLAALGAPRAYSRALPGYARRLGVTDRVVREHDDPWRGDDLYVAQNPSRQASL